MAKKFAFLLVVLNILVIVASFDSNLYDSLKSQLFSTCLKKIGTPTNTTKTVYVARDDDDAESKSYYSDLNYQWNTRKGTIHPLGFVVAQSVPDVQNAVRCGRKLKIRLVARSGGHSFEKYSFGDSDSIVLDLHKLSKVGKVNALKRTVWVGSGALTGPVSYKLWESGKFMVPLGGSTTIGMAGLTLGGGYGQFSLRFGLTLDFVRGAEMVDGNGEVRIANESTNPDLFWALRGAGGGNFGIVTKLKFRLLDASTLKMTQLDFNYGMSAFDKVFEAWQSWVATDQTHFCLFNTNAKGPSIQVIGADMTEQEIEKVKQRFTASTPPSTTTSSITKFPNYIDLVAASGTTPVANPSQLIYSNKANDTLKSQRLKSYYSNKVLSRSEILRMKQIMEQMPVGGDINIELKTWAGAVAKVHPSATAFVHRTSLFIMDVNVKYDVDDDESDAKETNAKIDAWVSQVDAFATAVIDNGESYQNTVDAELTPCHVYLLRYYGSNLDRLIRVKKAVDPDNYFRFQQSIPTVNPFRP